MLELFPEEARERIEKEGSLRLFVSALLDLAEEQIREEEEAKKKKEQELKKKAHAMPTASSCSSLKNHLIEKNI